MADAIARNSRSWSSSATGSATSSCAGGSRHSRRCGSSRRRPGICHQVNLEYLATVVVTRDGAAFPDTLVGTDSHTPMVNGLGVVGWGVGGIEAEAAMLGQPISMLIPPVVGFRLAGELPEGATATDLVLTVTERLRATASSASSSSSTARVCANVPLENRATIGNMSPEYGSTITIFPVDDETLRYLRFTGRPAEVVDLVEAYAKEQGLWLDPSAEPVFSETLELDLSTVEPSLAGPARPQDRVPLREAKRRFVVALGQAMPDPAPSSHDEAVAESFPASDPPADAANGGDGEPEAAEPVPVAVPQHRPAAQPVPVTTADGQSFELDHGHVVIAAITSCTNTSNPQVMMAAGLLAKKAVERGLATQAVGEDVAGAGLPGRHGLLRAGRAHPLPRQARLQPRRLRLHDLHRQLRARSRPRSRPRSTTTTWPWCRCCRATGTSRAGSTATSA